METLAKKLSDPAIRVEGNCADEDPDVELAKKYVFEEILHSRQQRLVLELNNEPELLAMANRLKDLSPSDHERQLKYRSIKSRDDRHTVNNFLYFMEMTKIHLTFLKGPNGDETRERYMRELGLAVSDGC